MIEKKFGEHFQWGGGFAANQMEGAYLEGGKGLCLADINEFLSDVAIDKKNNEDKDHTATCKAKAIKSSFYGL